MNHNNLFMLLWGASVFHGRDTRPGFRLLRPASPPSDAGQVGSSCHTSRRVYCNFGICNSSGLVANVKRSVGGLLLHCSFQMKLRIYFCAAESCEPTILGTCLSLLCADSHSPCPHLEWAGRTSGRLKVFASDLYCVSGIWFSQ
jgi:hypothetical protein